MEERMLQQLDAAAGALNDEIRKLFWPVGTGDILEVQLFSAVAVSMSLYYVSDMSQVDVAKSVIPFGRYELARLAGQRKLDFNEIAPEYGHRYSLYSPLMPALFERDDPGPALMDALDVQVMGKPNGDPVRQRYLPSLVLVHAEMLRPIFNSSLRVD